MRPSPPSSARAGDELVNASELEAAVDKASSALDAVG
jgi:hypothetical protein